MRDFKSAELKVERADQHIHDIETRVAAFAANDAHKIVTEVNPGGVQIIKFDTTESLPTLVNLIFGGKFRGNLDG
jgi:hypothetical protein